MGAFDQLRGSQLSTGYWGNHTSTIDWCETNYTHTPYIAELVNTLTNLPSIALGIYGAAVTIKQGLPWRYALCYLGGTLIGLGSFGFHMTLRWEWQLMDELPMIYVTSLCAFLSFDTKPGFDFRFGLLGPIVWLSWCIFVTVSYAYLPNPVYHQIAFGALLISTVARYAILIRRLPVPTASKSASGASTPLASAAVAHIVPGKSTIAAAVKETSTDNGEIKSAPRTQPSQSLSTSKPQSSVNQHSNSDSSSRTRALAARPLILSTLLRGVITFILGFMAWNIDNFFCTYLQSFRSHSAIPEFVGLMSHGHGWWHLMTGYGAVLMITAGIYLQLAIKTAPELYTYSAADWIPITRRVVSPTVRSELVPRPTAARTKISEPTSNKSDDRWFPQSS